MSTLFFNFEHISSGKNGKDSMDKRKQLKEILERIKNLRLEKGYTQEFMAHKIGLSSVGYHKIEKGQTKLTLETFLEIASFLNVDEIELLDGGSKEFVFKEYFIRRKKD